MLPNNLDMLAVIIDERQRDLTKQIQSERFRALPYESGPIRRTIGRFLVWSGHLVGGRESESSPALSPRQAPGVFWISQPDTAAGR